MRIPTIPARRGRMRRAVRRGRPTPTQPSASARWPDSPTVSVETGNSSVSVLKGVILQLCSRIEMPVVQIQGQRVYYQHARPADKQAQATLVLIHGLGSSHAFYGPILDLLTENGYACLAVDTPGDSFSQARRTCSNSRGRERQLAAREPGPHAQGYFSYHPRAHRHPVD
jgi:hypothetical protein